MRLSRGVDLVHSDQVISVTSEKDRAISRPGQGGAVWDSGVLADWKDIDLQVNNKALGFKIPDLDTLGGGSAQPIPVGGEDQGVDDITSLQDVKALALSQVPKHGGSIFTSRSAERAIRRDSDGVQVTSVADKVGAESAVAERPNLDKLVPTSRNNDWGSLRRREANARNPFSVAFIGDGEFAITKGVPELDGAITRSGDDLSVVNAEGNRENITGVVNETAGATTRGDLPQSQGAIP
jgi:hypothetical protein